MKIFNIIIFLTVIILFNPNAFGQTELDCSQYNTKTWSGLMDKMRCKKGLPPKEKKDMIRELDAVVAHLYGLSEEQLIHIFETFHVGWNYQDQLDDTLEHFNQWNQKL